MSGLAASAVLLCAAAAAMAPGDARGAACGRVSIASMNWASAEVMAAIDRIILEAGFGCEVELVPGDNMLTFGTMARASGPDVAPEMFVNQFRGAIDEAVAEGRIAYGARVLTDGSEEGFWIPRYVADRHPEIRTVADALARPDLFPSPVDRTRGGVHTCPPGWGCQIMVDNLFRAYEGEDKGFDLVETGSAAGLDGSIAKAFAEQTGWLGYYWSPTAIIGRYPMKKLDWDVPFDETEWTRCTTQPDCPDPKRNSWTPTEVFTLITPRIAAENPEAARYLELRAWSNATVNRLLVWKEENGASGEDAARHFLQTQGDLWRGWVPADVADRVAATL